MIIIRPIEPSDLDSLSALADLTLFGLTTLPRDRALLRERIHESRRSFESKTKKPRGETYLFVMEDRQTGRVVGTCGIDAKVGGFEPFYAYLIETTLHESKVLNIRKEIRMLHLLQEHSGPSEIGSLFLSPEYRKSGNGRLLSLFRFMFMAEFRERFESQVIAEMRGVIDENGGSAFWEALGRHFFDVDFPRADYLSMKDKRFIAELMPTHPIYIDLLPQDARAVIGEVHPKTRPALRMLQKEGFQFSGMVDIFDGGPVMTSPLENIRTVRERAKTTVSEITNEGVPSEGLLLTNTDPDFRACVAPIAFVPDGGARINKTTAEALLLKAGGEMCFSPLRAR